MYMSYIKSSIGTQTVGSIQKLTEFEQHGDVQ